MNDSALETNQNSSLLSSSKVEFWAATTIFVFSVFFLSTSPMGPYQRQFEQARIPFHYYEDYFFPQLIKYTLLYLAFLLMNFKVLPRLIRKERMVLNIVLVVAAFLAIGLVFGILDTYTKNFLFNRYASEDDAYTFIFQNSFYYAFRLLLLFGFYCVIKFAAHYLLDHSEFLQAKYKIITRDALVAFVVWMVSMYFLLLVNAEFEVVLIWTILPLCGIALYCYSFYALLPKAMTKKKPFRSYLLQALLLTVLAAVPISLLELSTVEDEEEALAILVLNTFFQMLVTVPLTWVLYKRHLKGTEEVHVLKKELGRSNANLDFLRTQINPHFLFNALNTLYGTALQENSERTAQGIQMLGDMMRFMLHENHQQKILLSREVEYLRNYIDLQLLRTSSSPDIFIQTKIEDVLEEKFIAPMLLIPFVENAFKHGISLKNRSWIKVTLHCEQNRLFFDVYNSTHPKSEKDTEKDASGIGLANVRQRLALLYPGKHELIIRDTPEEYFVHLTIQL